MRAEITDQEARLFERLRLVTIAGCWTVLIIAIGVIIGYLSIVNWEKSVIARGGNLLGSHRL